MIIYEAFSPELKELIEDLKNGSKMIAMLAPSFVVDFDYKTIANELKSIGFDKVTEVTFGAKVVNEGYRKVLTETSGFHISSTCPQVIHLIKTRYPDRKDYLVPVVSPMVAMGRILKKNYPEHKTIFFAPCPAKKREAKHFPDDINVCITFKELKDLLEYCKVSDIKKECFDNNFDSFYNDHTKIYPLSGGLTESLHYKANIAKDRFIVEEGLPEVMKILDGHQEEHIKFLDILTCKGGCIGGPGICSAEPIEIRKQRVFEYMGESKRNKPSGERIGIDKYVEGLDFSRDF